MALSVDRFLAVQLHLRYQELVTSRRVAGVAILLWVLNIFISAVTFNWIQVLLLVIWNICFICITIIRSKLYFALRRHVNQIQALQAQRAAPKSNSELENAMKLRKSAVSVLYLYFVFILCYLPIYSSLAVQINFGLRRFSGPPLNNF